MFLMRIINQIKLNEYGGNKDEYRVVRFTDIEGKLHFLILYGLETVHCLAD